jgi:hypothetical protein
MIRSISLINIRFSYIAILFLAWLGKRRTAGFTSTRLPLCQPPLILGQEMLSLSVSYPMHYLPYLAEKKAQISLWYYRTRHIMFASHVSSYGNGTQTKSVNNESYDRPKSLFHAGGRGHKNVGRGKKKPMGIRPFAMVATLALVAFAFLRLFTNPISGTPNYVYYARSVKESTTINSNGKVIREREEDFRSNIPGLSGENFNSQPEVPSHGLEWNSPYLNSMRLQQQGLERLMEQQQLDMQEEMSKMMELFWH